MHAGHDRGADRGSPPVWVLISGGRELKIGQSDSPLRS